jgi:hypothetical protein
MAANLGVSQWGGVSYVLSEFEDSRGRCEVLLLLETVS